MPARNAPRATDSPNWLISHAEPRATEITVSRNTSRVRVASTARKTRGIRNRATTSRATTAKTARANSHATSKATPLLLPPASAGTSSVSGITSRSWKISAPTMKRPCGASNSPRTVSTRSTTTVLDSATTSPKTMPRGTVSPAIRRMASVARVVTPTCKEPPNATAFQMKRRRESENSSPTANKSRITPISAICSMCSESPTSPRPCGPAMAPVIRNPTVEGRPKRCRPIAAATARPPMTASSPNRSSSATRAPGRAGPRASPA